MTSTESSSGDQAAKSTEFTGSGTDDRLRAELETMANDLAAKHTMAFVVPVKQILAAVYKVFADVPRVPNYNADLPWNEQPSWLNVMTISLTELPDNPAAVRSWYLTDSGEIRIMIENGDESCSEITLELASAKAFFLQGLAAVMFAERQKLITQIDEPA